MGDTWTKAELGDAASSEGFGSTTVSDSSARARIQRVPWGADVSETPIGGRRARLAWRPAKLGVAGPVVGADVVSAGACVTEKRLADEQRGDARGFAPEWGTAERTAERDLVAGTRRAMWLRDAGGDLARGSAIRFLTASASREVMKASPTALPSTATACSRVGISARSAGAGLGSWLGAWVGNRVDAREAATELGTEVTEEPPTE
jgi:hypothetical protein